MFLKTLNFKTVRNFGTRLGAISALALGGVGGSAIAAQAGTIYNGWNYAIDSSMDSIAGNGTGGHLVGDTIYEIYGMAVKADAENFWIAINSNLPITGQNTGPELCNGADCYPILNDSITWGDIFIDFSNKEQFSDAVATESFYAIRFADTNDSNAPGIGVYPLIKSTTSVVEQNSGWSFARNNYMSQAFYGIDSDLGDLAWNDPYYAGMDLAHNIINEPGETNWGDPIDPIDLTLLTLADLNAEGLDWNFLTANGGGIGDYTIGMKFSHQDAAFPVGGGDFIITAFLECFNDGIALKGNLPEREIPAQDVPESGMLVGFAGLLGAILRRKKLS